MKEIKIQIPEGYDGIDEEASNFAEGRIVFKKKEETPWRSAGHVVTGFFVNELSVIEEVKEYNACYNDNPEDRNVFATEKQAKSALAMAQLSQIIANDPRFGGPVTDEEWGNGNTAKYTIERADNEITIDTWWNRYHFLSFYTAEQRDLFMKENMDLIRQYYGLD